MIYPAYHWQGGTPWRPDPPCWCGTTNGPVPACPLHSVEAPA